MSNVRAKKPPKGPKPDLPVGMVKSSRGEIMKAYSGVCELVGYLGEFHNEEEIKEHGEILEVLGSLIRQLPGEIIMNKFKEEE